MTQLSTTAPNDFVYTGTIETVTVGTTGYYEITADGAQGGEGLQGTGGLGAQATGLVYLQAGAQFEIVVGGMGQNSPWPEAVAAAAVSSSRPTPDRAPSM